MNNLKFICIVGISASGKSTQAKILAEQYNANIHSSDGLREELYGDVSDQTHNEEVFKELHKRVKQDLLGGNSVVYDATNINIKARRSVLENIKKIDCTKIAYVMTKSVEKCIEDNIYRATPVPHHVIKRQHTNFQIPFKGEGFDEIMLHKHDENFYYDKNRIQKSMVSFDQKTKWHIYDLLTHCNKCAEELSKENAERILIETAKIHDYGKLFCQTIGEDGNCHYYQHENIGAYSLLQCLDCFDSYTDDEISDILFYVNYHMMPFAWKNEKTHNKYRKLFGERKYNNLLVFNEADKIASGTE